MEEIRAKAEAKAKEKIIISFFVKKTNDVGRLWLPTDKAQISYSIYGAVTVASWLQVVII